MYSPLDQSCSFCVLLKCVYADLRGCLLPESRLIGRTAIYALARSRSDRAAPSPDSLRALLLNARQLRGEVFPCHGTHRNVFVFPAVCSEYLLNSCYRPRVAQNARLWRARASEPRRINATRTARGGQPRPIWPGPLSLASSTDLISTSLLPLLSLDLVCRSEIPVGPALTCLPVTPRSRSTSPRSHERRSGTE